MQQRDFELEQRNNDLYNCIVKPESFNKETTVYLWSQSLADVFFGLGEIKLGGQNKILRGKLPRETHPPSYLKPCFLSSIVKEIPPPKLKFTMLLPTSIFLLDTFNHRQISPFCTHIFLSVPPICLKNANQQNKWLMIF